MDEIKAQGKVICDHEYVETSSCYDMDGETYECKKCGDRYRLYYEDMA